MAAADVLEASIVCGFSTSGAAVATILFGLVRFSSPSPLPENLLRKFIMWRLLSFHLLVVFIGLLYVANDIFYQRASRDIGAFKGTPIPRPLSTRWHVDRHLLRMTSRHHE